MKHAIFPAAVVLIFGNFLCAADSAADSIAAGKVRSGVISIVGAEDLKLAKSLVAEGRIAVDLLTRVDEATAHAWRTELMAERRGGLVSVVRFRSFAQLPYPDRFVNALVIDLDALGSAAPSDQELRRVIAPYGTLLTRQAGKWKTENVGLAAGLDEWTHFEHGADGNPTSRDQLVSHVRGLQWASYDLQAIPGSTPRIAEGVHARAMVVGGDKAQQTVLFAREAGNGLLRWRIYEAEGHRTRRSEVYERSWCIADDRIHGLVGDIGKWAQSIDLTTGKTVLVYDQGIPAPAVPDKLLSFRQRTEESRWTSDVTVAGSTNSRGPYSLGLLHIALEGCIIQGGNAPADDLKPQEFPLGPAKQDSKKRPTDAPQPPQRVEQSAAYRGLVVALNPTDGSRLWKWEAPVGLQVAYLVGGEGSVVVGLTRSTIGIGVHYRNVFIRLEEVAVLDAKNGQERWRSNKVHDFLTHAIVVADGGLYVADHHVYTHEGDLRRLVRFDLTSGQIDFDETPAIENKSDNWKNRFAILAGRVYLGGNRNLVDFDARTGQDVNVTPTTLPGYGTKIPGLSLGHCSTWRATPNGWLSGRFARFIPFDGAMENRCAVSRNWCDEGHYPAYGMCYSGYHPACACSTYLIGHTGLNSLRPDALVPDAERLERGPAWGTLPGKVEAKDQWPTFRADAQRSSFVDARLGSSLKLLGTDRLTKLDPAAGPLIQAWASSILPIISAPVVVDGVALVSLTHDRELRALEVSTGKTLWSRPLGARSVYPPTVHRGLVYVGGADGFVSCLRLAEGQLVWRFMAAPSHRRAAIASQVESAWPVPGVVIHEGRAYAVAGTHNQLDGGLYAWALNPADGKILGRGVITSGFSNVAPWNKAPAQDMEGRTNDIPSIDLKGRALHVRDIAVDTQTWNWVNVCTFLDNKVQEVGGFTRADLPALFTRMLENHNAMYRPMTMRFGGGGLGIKFNMSWLAWHGLSHDVEGADLAIAPDRVVAAQNGKVVAYQLDERGLPVNTPRPNSNIARDLAPAALLSKEYRERAAIAATKDRIVITQPVSNFKPASLVLLAADGTELAKAELPANPHPTSLAIAGDVIVVGTVDGALHRFSTKDER